MTPSPSATRPKPLHVFLVHAGFVTALLGLLPATTAVAPLLLQQEGNLLFGSFGAGRSLREAMRGSTREDEAVEIDPELEQQLEALGYAG